MILNYAFLRPKFVLKLKQYAQFHRDTKPSLTLH